ncbi:hypothetical protein BJ322DRAFT_1109578 [Thelephora terrestris]|uniref:Uncharacterized protein n=1 Tax=Thelephora terrestris TaxID=56493 RepID=A0A9P6HDY2_9AGAM|nr:hypothetical protein BJ322DRAFT_1109578 [Thelephora terrestris]
MTNLSDTENEQTPLIGMGEFPPQSNSYLELPSPNKSRAPPTFTGAPNTLEPFLENYNHLCKRYDVTSSKEQYQGLIRYCDPGIANLLRTWPSHAYRDYATLLVELEYFFGDRQGCLNMGKIEAFTTKWRARKMCTLDQFKCYQLKFHQLIGRAREKKKISTRDVNRYFWEANPLLDVTVPFSIAEIVEGAGTALNPNRFDQHLTTKGGYRSSESDSDEGGPGSSVKILGYVSDDESENEPKSLIQPKQLPTPPKTPPRTTLKTKKHKAKKDEEFDSLVEDLSKLSVNEPAYWVNNKTRQIRPPTNPNQDIVEGKMNNQILPMAVDKEDIAKPPNRLRKNTTHLENPNVPKVPNIRTKKKPDSSAITSKIMNANITLTVQEAIDGAPSLRRDLVGVMKQGTEVSSQVQEKISFLGEVIEYEQDPLEATDQEISTQEPESETDEETDPTDEAVLMTEPRDGLIKIPVNVEGTMMTGVFDSGSQLNIISQRLVEKAGIPWSRSRRYQIPLISVDGNITKPAGMIPRAQLIMETDTGQVRTISNLHVKHDAGFQLLLGREWGVKNKANWIEDEERPHITIQTNKGVRKIRPLPTHIWPGQRGTNHGQHKKKTKQFNATVFAAGRKEGIEEGEVPDSENDPAIGSNKAHIDTAALEERENDFENSPFLIGAEDPPTPAQRRQEIEFDEEVDRIGTGDEEGRIGEEEELDVAEEARGKGKERTLGSDSGLYEPENKCTIRSELRETFIKMVQNGVSNNEWNKLQELEQREMECDNTQWQKMEHAHSDDEKTNSTGDSDPENARFQTPPDPASSQPSNTLPTPQPNISRSPPASRKQKRTLESGGQSPVTRVTRSRRIRRRTERTKGEEYQRILRTYQRKEQMERKRIHGRGAALAAELHAFAAEIVPEEETPEESARDTRRHEDVKVYTQSDKESEGKDGYTLALALDILTSDDERNGPSRPRREKVCSYPVYVKNESIELEPTKEWDRDVMAIKYEGTELTTKPKRILESGLYGKDHPGNNSDRPRNELLEVEKNVERKSVPDRSCTKNEDEHIEPTLQYERMDMNGCVEENRPGNEKLEGRRSEVSKEQKTLTHKGSTQHLTPPTDITYPVTDSRGPDAPRTDRLGQDHPRPGQNDPKTTINKKEDREEWTSATNESPRYVEARTERQMVHDQMEPQLSSESVQTVDKGQRIEANEDEPDPKVSTSTVKGRVELGVRNDCASISLTNPKKESVGPMMRRDIERKSGKPERGSYGTKGDDRNNIRNIAQPSMTIEQWRQSQNSKPALRKTEPNLRHKYPGKFQNDPYEGMEMLGIKYVPQPRAVPTGLLASKEVTIFADDDIRHQRHFFARDVTLATVDPFGNPVFFHGNATIQLDEPGEGSTIHVPKRRKVNKARKYIFGKKKGVPLKEQAKEFGSEQTSETTHGNEITWYVLNQEELEAVLGELADDPITQNEETRTYTIWKTEDGTIKAQLGLKTKDGGNEPSTQAHNESPLENTDKEVSGGMKITAEEQDQALTIKGSNPQAPDHMPRPMNTKNNTGDEGTYGKESEIQENVKHPGNKETRRQLEGSEHCASIKTAGPTYSEKSTPSPLTTQISANTDPKTNGRGGFKSCKCSALTATPQAQENPAREVRHQRYGCEPEVPVRVNVPSEGEYLRIDVPPPEDQNPGMMVAAHLVCVKEDILAPDEHSFFAFGATIVVGEEGCQQPFVHHGQAYVHLFNSSSDDLSNQPPPNHEQHGATATTPDEPRYVNPKVLVNEDIDSPRTSPFPGQSIAGVVPRPLAVEVAIKQLRVLIPEEDPMKKPAERGNARDCVPDGVGREPSTPIHNPQTTQNRVPSDLLAVPRHNVDISVFPCTILEDSQTKVFKDMDNELTLKGPPIATLDPEEDMMPDSPPALDYPDNIMVDELAEDDELMLDIPGLHKSTDAPPSAKSLDPTKDEDDPTTDEDLRLITRIQENLLYLSPYIDRIQENGEKHEVFECLAKLGLLQIVYEMTLAKDQGEMRGKQYWGRRIAQILDERKTEVEEFIEEKRREGKIAKKPRPVTIIKIEDEVEAPPYSPVEWLPQESDYVPKSPAAGVVEDPRYVPRSPEPEATEAPVKLSKPDADPLTDLQQQVLGLEERFDGSIDDLKTRLKELETQVFSDGCLLTELNWKSNELKKWENKGWSNNKKAHRRNNTKGNPPYQTRSVTAASAESVKEMRRQLTKLGDRIRKVEVDIQIAQEEIKITNDKIRKLSMLDSQVKLSAQNLDDLRRSQAGMNSVLMSEIASLKLGLGPRLEQQLKDHAFEINTLTSRFQQLYHVVVNTLYPDYPKTSDPRNANQTSPKITSNPKTAAVF